MKDIIQIFENPEKLAMALADRFRNMIIELSQTRKTIHIALSGGSTPKLFFETLAKHHCHLPWRIIHFYWVDERCVPANNHESNYGMTKKSLLDKIDIPTANIHHVMGDVDPETEAIRYGEDISRNVSSQNRWPAFDCILLGLGEDGHTASLFPRSPLLDKSDSTAAVAVHPQTHQKRITLTLPVINHAKKIIFLISGQEKAQIVESVLGSNKVQSDIPATLIKPLTGKTEWYLDKSAAERLT